MDDRPDPRIRWTPRVGQALIARLYETDAKGILDTELIDEVGLHLLTRVQDVLLVANRRVRCPVCGSVFEVRWGRDDAERVFTCPTGDWELTGRQYHASWQKQDLHGYSPALDVFADAYPKARTPRERMLLIDALIHAIHQSSRGEDRGGNIARNLIEGGRRNSVHAFLDRLAGTDLSTRDEEARARFDRSVHNQRRRGVWRGEARPR